MPRHSDKKHWKTGHSAKALAYCWEEAKGFPSSIKSAFTKSGLALLKNTEPLFVFPEYKVSLPGGKRASHNDIYVIANTGNELISIMVEGKVSEPFGLHVSAWLSDKSIGKKRKAGFLTEKPRVRDC